MISAATSRGREPQADLGRRRRSLLGTLLAAMLSGTPALAGHTEVWLGPPSRCWDGTVCLEPIGPDGDPVPGESDCMRDDWLPSVSPVGQWSELLGQATVWQIGHVGNFEDTVLTRCMAVMPLTDAEMDELVAATEAAGVEIGIEVGGYS